MRYLIIEPCAYPDGGHNIESCLRFSNALEENGSKIEELWIAGNPKKYQIPNLNFLV